MPGQRTLTKDEAADIARRAYADPVFFCKFFLEKWFPSRMPWVHRGLLAVLTRRCGFLKGDPELDKIVENFVWFDEDDVDQAAPHPIFLVDPGTGDVSMVLGKFTLLLIPRGFAKTTLANAVNLMNILYQECKFPLYVSKTGRHASRQLSSITKQLTSNPRVLAVFGELKPPQRNEAGLKWSESDGFIQTVTGVRMAAVGSGGQVRGMLDDAQRPDRIYIDDLEDKESTRTDDRRQDTREWFFSDLLPVLPELDGSASAVMMSNLVHQDCLATHIMKDPEWTIVHFGALDRAGEPLWPELLDKDKLEGKKRSYALQGKLHLFYMEYHNEIRVPENAKFRPEFFIYDPVGQDKLFSLAIAIDPAISERKKSDFCTITVVGMRSDGFIQILDQWGKVGASPREQVDTYFDLIEKWGLTLRGNSSYGVETNAYQAALVHLLQEEMFRRKVYFEITRLTHSSEKIARIEGVLQPRYANGFIHHQRRFSELETSLLDWPNTKFDWADSAAMAVGLLDDSAPIVATDDLRKDSMPPLEEVFGGDWRSY